MLAAAHSDGLVAEEPLVLLEDHLAPIVDRRDAQPGPLLDAEELPGDDVGVVLEPRDDDLVALADVAAAPALRDEVDALGRAAHEDNLLGRRRVEEAADLVASALVGVGRARSEGMRRAVHVGVLALVVIGDAIDDRLRLLRGCGVVEPYEPSPVHTLLQDGKISLHRVRVEGAELRVELRDDLGSKVVRRGGRRRGSVGCAGGWGETLVGARVRHHRHVREVAGVKRKGWKTRGRSRHGRGPGDGRR
jgi:hypothetical protein